MSSSSTNKGHVFVQQFNATTGKTEWGTRHENYDYHQEIARSAFADMMHDEERNKKYYEGLRIAISKLRDAGRQIRVLDIGTGAGLLSLMAAKLGVDEIYACEAFGPMAKCAKEVIQRNGYTNKITLIPKHSTDITVGPNGDMPHRANLLVTEVFDTELIGEGAIRTFNHAHKYLLEERSLVVPCRATVHVQLVESNDILKWHRLLPIDCFRNKIHLQIPNEMITCLGSASVLDVQMSNLPFVLNFLTDAHVVARFDFAAANDPIPEEEVLTKKVTARSSGECHGVLFWWELDMDYEGSVNLSCAPKWSHPKGKQQPWRDHWMQAIYFPSKRVSFVKGDTIEILSCHDEYSFWFDVSSSQEQSVYSSWTTQPERPMCTCCVHAVCNYSRLGIINDKDTAEKYCQCLSELVVNGATCLFIGETSLLPLMAVCLGAQKVYVVDGNYLSRKMLSSIIKKNNMQNKIVQIDKTIDKIQKEDLEMNEIDLVFGEPFFTSSLLPWHNLHFWYAKSTLHHLINCQTKIMPESGRLWAIAVHFKDLWKIRAPLVSVEGFQMDPFDKLIMKSSDIADSLLEPHPLWEYENTALSTPFCLFTFDFRKATTQDTLKSEDVTPLLSTPKCNGIALWMEWQLNDKITIQRGPVSRIVLGETIQWDVNSRQAVYFVRHCKSALPNNKDQSQTLSYSASFDIGSGNVQFEFSVK